MVAPGGAAALTFVLPVHNLELEIRVELQGYVWHDRLARKKAVEMSQAAK